jgi:2-methylcitrate dehydratase PrpD
MSATQQLAQYAADLRYEDLPAEIVDKAKVLIRDSLGCLLAGGTLESASQVRGMIMPMAASGPCSVAGARRRIAAPLAAYINAQLTNFFDFDDTLEGRALGHPGATVIPAALALAEQTGATGRDLITAVVAGYEVYSRVAMAGKPSFERQKQVRGLAPWQVFSTAGAAIQLLKLDGEAAARALCLAALHTVVPSIGKVYEERPMWGVKNNYGWVTMGGVMGCLYAAAGYPANHAILDGPTGFWAMVGSDRCDFALLTEGLGSTYGMLDTAIKPYSSCRHTQSPLDALSQIVRRAHPRPEDVRSVVMRGGSKILVFSDYRPATYIAAQFSLPYLASMVIMGVPTGYGWVSGGRWRDPAVLALMDRVKLEADPEAEAVLAQGYMLARVSMELADGRVEQAETTFARGNPRNPLSETELRDKFMGLAGPAIGAAAARKLNESLERLETLEGVAGIAAMLRRRPGSR